MSDNAGVSVADLQKQFEAFKTSQDEKFEQAQREIERLRAEKGDKKSSNQLKEGPLTVNWEFLEEFFKAKPLDTQFFTVRQHHFGDRHGVTTRMRLFTSTVSSDGLTRRDEPGLTIATTEWGHQVAIVLKHRSRGKTDRWSISQIDLAKTDDIKVTGADIKKYNLAPDVKEKDGRFTLEAALKQIESLRRPGWRYISDQPGNTRMDWEPASRFLPWAQAKVMAVRDTMQRNQEMNEKLEKVGGISPVAHLTGAGL